MGKKRFNYKEINSFFLLFLSFIVWFVSFNSVNGQQTANLSFDVTFPLIALVDIEPSGSKDITFNFAAPLEAGIGIIQTLTNNSLWLNYTNSTLSEATPKKINVHLSSSTALLQSLVLNLQAATVIGGAGTRGTSSGAINLSTTPQSIITGIGRSFTGNGSGFGHQLTYTLSINQSFYDSLESGNFPVQVIFTITE